MYIAFVYDHKYVKNDRDFYADAIVSFYPAESKEKVYCSFQFVLEKKKKLLFIIQYVYLIGQIIGTVDFFKGFLNSKLNQFKMDTMLIEYKIFSSQYSLVKLLKALISIYIDS